MSGEWPWPADTSLDIARRLLQSYRGALMNIDPEACKQIDAHATGLGQGWVAPKVETVDPDDLVVAADAAEIAGVTVYVIRQWAYRKYIPRHHAEGHPTRYRVGDILDHVASVRRQRAERRTGQRST